MKKYLFVGIISLLYFLLSCQSDAIADKSITFGWDAPTVNIDGTPITDMAGYKLYKRNPATSAIGEYDTFENTF